MSVFISSLVVIFLRQREPPSVRTAALIIKTEKKVSAHAGMSRVWSVIVPMMYDLSPR